MEHVSYNDKWSVYVFANIWFICSTNAQNCSNRMTGWYFTHKVNGKQTLGNLGLYIILSIKCLSDDKIYEKCYTVYQPIKIKIKI